MKGIIRISVLVLLLLALAVLPAVASGIYSSEVSLAEDEAWKAKITDEVLRVMDAMTDEDTVSVWCYIQNLDEEAAAKFKAQTGFDWNKLSTNDPEETERWRLSVIAAKEAELGLASGSIDPNSNEAWSAVSDAFEEKNKTYRDIKREVYMTAKQAFLDRNINPSRSFSYCNEESNMLNFTAGKSEVISAAMDESCTRIGLIGLVSDYIDTDEETSWDANTSFDENVEYPIPEETFTSLRTYALDLNGDVNGDGKVDSLDAAQVLKYDADLLEEFANKAPEYALSAEAEEQLCKAYFDYYNSKWPMGTSYEEESVEVISYYGNHSGCEVAYFSDSFLQETMAYETYIIAGYVFQYSTGRQIDVCKDGVIYPLTEAYQRGFLTAEDIRKIAVQGGSCPEYIAEPDDSNGESLGLYVSVWNIIGDVNYDRRIDNLDAAWILKFDAGLVE